jgi:hypothetical protein
MGIDAYVWQATYFIFIERKEKRPHIMIEQPKTYIGRDLDTIFFRPIAHELGEKLGVRVMLNMPTPTVVTFWKQNESRNLADKYSVSLEFGRTKHELSTPADEYFNEVMEKAERPYDDFDSISIEQAECELLQKSLTTKIKHDFWSRVIEKLDEYDPETWQYAHKEEDKSIVTIFECLYSYTQEQTNILSFSKEDLGLFVSSDVYKQYELYLDNFVEFWRACIMSKELAFRGIRLYDIGKTEQPIAILTPKKNLVLALNIQDFPGCEVRMWYNPDDVKNRQRAVFAMEGRWVCSELVCFTKI